MSQPANDDFSQHLSDGEESNHEDASDTGSFNLNHNKQNIPKPLQSQISQTPNILKKEEYEIGQWSEHYLSYIDNEVWKVIQNGNSKKRISTGKDGVIRVLSPVSAAEIQAVEKERKAKNILLMAIPKEHMIIYSRMYDAKDLENRDMTGFQQFTFSIGSSCAEKKLEARENQWVFAEMDDGIVQLGKHTEAEESNHALMAISLSNGGPHGRALNYEFGDDNPSSNLPVTQITVNYLVEILWSTGGGSFEVGTNQKV
ncbi:hypothetical protein Tco_0320232 [Tanacetum coccineum]